MPRMARFPCFCCFGAVNMRRLFRQGGHIVLTPLYCDLIVFAHIWTQARLYVSSVVLCYSSSVEVRGGAKHQRPPAAASVAFWQSSEAVEVPR